MSWGAVECWLDKIEPGSWSEWVGAILTGGSLILGFSILRWDRRRAARAQASRVLAWIVDAGDQSAMQVKNTSDMPVFGPTLMTRPRFWWEVRLRVRILRWKKHFEYKVFQYQPYGEVTLEPGEIWTDPFPFAKRDAAFHRTILRFQDAAGVVYRRDVSFGSDRRFLGRLNHYTESTIMSLGTAKVVATMAQRREPLPDLDEGYSIAVNKTGYVLGRLEEPEPLDGRGDN